MTHLNLNSTKEARNTYFVQVWNYDDNDIDTIIEIHNEIIQLDAVDDADIKTMEDIKRVFQFRFPFDHIDIFPLRWEYNGISFLDK